jgi:hypothetical protein
MIQNLIHLFSHWSIPLSYCHQEGSGCKWCNSPDLIDDEVWRLVANSTNVFMTFKILSLKIEVNVPSKVISRKT